MKVVIAALVMASLLLAGHGVLAAPNSWVVLATADFDGDGREDRVLGETTMVVDAYRTIRVQAASGKQLVHLSSGQFFQSARVAAQGFPTPILVTTQAAGTQYDVRAFMYDTRAGQLQPLQWDGQAVALAQSVKFQPGALVLHTWGGNREVYRLHAGRLVRHK